MEQRQNSSARTTRQRIEGCVREVLPSTTKTCIWLLKITIGVSVLILFMKYFGILPWISNALSPLFNIFGLPGETALAFVTGYFVNVYAMLAIAGSLDLTARAITILGVMTLCAHNMITETAVQGKTGANPVRVVITRTLSAFVLAFALNHILPLSEGDVKILGSSLAADATAAKPLLKELFTDWAWSTLSVLLKMTTLIYTLAIMQRLLSEFGVIRWVSKFLRPLLYLFGLPAKTAFLWIVANILGIAYGGAVMMDEVNAGNLNKKDIKLVNQHIGISHSNFEDLTLISSLGGVWWIMLLTRWAGSFLLVWGYRAEMAIRKKLLTLHA